MRRPTETLRAPEILTAAAWLVAACVALLGCGAEPRTNRATHLLHPSAPDASTLVASLATLHPGGVHDAGADAIVELLTLDAVSAQGPWLAPGMHEIVRHEVTNETKLRRDVVRGVDHDVCVRVAFAAGAPVHAWLEDGAAALLAEVERGDSGVLGTRGPVCVRKSDAIVVRAESLTPTRIRVVAWSAP